MPAEKMAISGRFDFELPDELIARHPVDPPDSCRLMVLNRQNETISHHRFTDLPDLIPEGTLIIGNNSGVEARRVALRRLTGTPVEALFLEPLDDERKVWKALVKKARRLNNDETLQSIRDPGFTFRFYRKDDHTMILESDVPLSSREFTMLGEMPIPPYLRRDATQEDRIHYQNPFHRDFGSAAAPTASLHFTQRITEALQKKNVTMDFVTLHIGYGTFAPLTEKNFAEKKLHRESLKIPSATLKKIQKAITNEPRQILSLGTTSLRALETLFRDPGFLEIVSTEEDYVATTELFLTPPEKVQSVDMLLTNFHLPGSSLLHLTACMAESNFIMRAYREAVQEKYRFFSYGDAMLIL